jgi:hypothetical protein
MEAHHGDVEVQTGAMKAHPGNVQALPRIMDYPVFVKAHTGVMEDPPGTMEDPLETPLGAVEASPGPMEANSVDVDKQSITL